jgi:HD superfamily phosphodiesterase
MSSLIQIASIYITRRFESQLDSGITYHNLTHTKEVVDSAKKIGAKSGLVSDLMEIILLAAWFHDVGIIERYKEHEEKALKLVVSF